MEYAEAIRTHLSNFFEDDSERMERWHFGPMADDRRFHVLIYPPSSKTNGLWFYCSVGASQAKAARAIEFFVVCQASSSRLVELVTMVSHYHRKNNLGVFHTLPIGEPWLEDSTCDCFLVSLPYPFGEELELMNMEGHEARILWLLPITSAERAYTTENGVDALEERLDDCAIEYWDIHRKSVV